MTNIIKKTANSELIEHYAKPIAHFWNEEGITSICINRFDGVYVRKNGEYILTDVTFGSEDKLYHFISQISKNLKQVVDENNPILDARMPDGARINAVLSSNSTRGANVTIRLFPKVRFSVNDLLARGMFSNEMLCYMHILVKTMSNVLVSGQSGSGKTTLLNAIGNLIPKNSRTLIIEDTSELNLDVDNIIQMEAPHRVLPKDVQPITMARLVINTLRQEPERTIVGEIRDVAAASALQVALNVGNRGILSTLHANNALQTFERFQDLLLNNDTRLPYDVLVNRTRDAIDAVVFADRTPNQGQRVVELAETQEDREVKILWQWDYKQGKHVANFKDFRALRVVKKALDSNLVDEAFLSNYGVVF